MLYYKIISGQEVISTCRTIHTDAGWICNPTEEQILADGWLPYTPPPVIPSPQEEPDYEEVVTAIKKMFSYETETLSDEEALEVAALYPTWSSKIGKQVAVGERLWYDERLWKVIQAHTVQEDWNPRDAVSLFTKVSIEEWPEWRQPTGAQDAYRLGAKVSHEGKHWENNLDFNTYEPGIYGWIEV